MRRPPGLRLPMIALVLLAGCRGGTSSRPPIHLNPNMDTQPKYLAQAESTFFADGATMRVPVEGTVARGELPVADPLHTGRENGSYVTAMPVPVSDRLLRRGEERFGIYCTPCHGARGDGKGMLFLRAQVESADLREARIVAMPEGQIFETIGRGIGLMRGYDYLLPIEDRWAVVAHVRRLQGETPMTVAELANEEGEQRTAADRVEGTERSVRTDGLAAGSAPGASR